MPTPQRSAPSRSTVRAGLSLLSLLTLVVPAWLAASACGVPTVPPEDPSNADKEGDGGDSLPTSQAASGPEPSGSATIKDDTDKKAMNCGGATIADLADVLAQSACEAANTKPDEPEKDVKDALEISVTTDSPKVAPGGTAKVTVTYHNKGKTVLPLDFVVDPEPRFSFEVYTLKGARADKPAGDSPALPPEVQNAPEPDKAVARVTLAPNGTAKLTETWTAVKYKWASKDKAKGALPGRGYPTEPSGPLPKGKYTLRVITPLVGVSEGVDHELSQPRTNVEIGNL